MWWGKPLPPPPPPPATTTYDTSELGFELFVGGLLTVLFFTAKSEQHQRLIQPVIYLTVGAAVYYVLESWHWLDSVYFMIVTIA